MYSARRHRQPRIRRPAAVVWPVGRHGIACLACPGGGQIPAPAGWAAI